MKKRLFSLLLALVMVFALIPTAMAIEDPMEEMFSYTDGRGNHIEVPRNSFATRVVSFTPGSKWTSDRDHVTAENILGTPEGNNLCLGAGGVIVLEFAVDIVDNEGLDIYVFEVGPDVEATQVEVSVDGKEWLYVGKADGSLSGVDLAGVAPEGARYHYVRITDLSTHAGSQHPGADIVAVAGLNVKSIPFVDIGLDQYYYGPVAWAYDNGITNGIGDDKFDPNASSKRCDVVTYLWRLNGEPASSLSKSDIPFTDVDLDSYYGKALMWAYENEVVLGISDTEFAPARSILRCEFVSLLYRNMGKPAYSVSNPFVDVAKGTYYYDAVLWAYENGVTSGMDATHFAPDQPCTRAQIVTFLYRFDALQEPEQDTPAEPEQPWPDDEYSESIELADDLMDYLNGSLDLFVKANPNFEQVPTTNGSTEYTDGTLVVGTNAWDGDGTRITYIYVRDTIPQPLAGLVVGMDIGDAQDILAENGWTARNSNRNKWIKDDLVLTFAGTETVTQINLEAF